MSDLTVSVQCPHCSSSLMDPDYRINNAESIRLNIALKEGPKGVIHLSAIYGDYNYTSNLVIPEDAVVKFYCPACRRSLRRKKIDCDYCSAPMITFNCVSGGRISICTRHGCTNHFVAFEDPDAIVRKYFTEYGFH